MKFKKRISIQQVEEGVELAPKFDDKGVIPCITVHTKTKEVLMFAYMISSGFAHYWSRSRESLWKKGETSGMIQKVERMLIDDDQDSLVIEVSLTEPSLGGNEASCHVGYKSCFYREVSIGEENIDKPLKFIENEKSFDPEKIYKNIPNPTKL